MKAKLEAEIREIVRKDILKALETHINIDLHKSLVYIQNDFRETTITYRELFGKILDHLGLALESTPPTISLVAVKKPRKKTKRKAHKAKKKG